MNSIPTVRNVVLVLGLALLVAACGSDDDPTFEIPEGLLINAASGDAVEVNGTTWVEPCFDDGGGDGRENTFTFSVAGSERVESFWTGDLTCSGAPDSENVIPFNLTIDGDQPDTDWDPAAPAGLDPVVTASRVTITGEDPMGGPFEFPYILFIDDLSEPRVLYEGSGDDPQNDAEGYPTRLGDNGLSEQ